MAEHEQNGRLTDAIAKKVRKGYWIESQSASEARIVCAGRKRWLGLFGGRVPEKREIVRLESNGATSIEVLPKRRY